MPTTTVPRPSIGRTIGSLKFGSVILALLLVAMATATVYESTQGAERTLFDFYQTWWFKGLLGLLALNVGLAVLLRYPFHRRQIGFLVTHASLLAILGGAWISQRFGVEGQLAIREGQSVAAFSVRTPQLRLMNRSQQTSAGLDLRGRAFQDWRPAEKLEEEPLLLDAIRLEVRRFMPDSRVVERMVNDNPHPQAAIEVVLSGSSGEKRQWLLEEQSADLGGRKALFRVIESNDEWRRMLAPADAGSPASKGDLKIEFRGHASQISVDKALSEAVAIEESGLSIRVLRYLPHATVGADRQLVNVTEQPVNPAVEVEITSANGTEKRIAFARFPDFRSMHGAAGHEDLKLTFVAASAPEAPIEILAGPAGAFALRTTAERGEVNRQSLSLGSPAKLPSGESVALAQKFDHARWDRTYEPVLEARDGKNPVLMVKVTSAKSNAEIWLEKNRVRSLSIDGAPYELMFSDKSIPLGFEVGLNRFTVGRYPGENRPRSFESQVTLTDAAKGLSQSCIISMNNPTKYGGYTLFQSSYSMEEGGAVSVLTVSRDPGLPVVFTGYIGLMLGMLTVLFTRYFDRRRVVPTPASPGTRVSGRRHNIDLLHASRRCVSGVADVPSLPDLENGHAMSSKRNGNLKVHVLVGLVSSGLMVLPSFSAVGVVSELDLQPMRELAVQHDGRWPPLDTVARDIVKSVTGTIRFEGNDPVWLLLSWTFEPNRWMNEPLISIRNAELRGELQLSPQKTVFSYQELIQHPRLRALIDELAHMERGRKPDPLQTKVGDIHEKLLKLQQVFAGRVIRPIPDAKDVSGSWLSFAATPSSEGQGLAEARQAWSNLGTALVKNDAASFTKAANELRDRLAKLPAAYRPSASQVATELRYNGLRPYRTSWNLLVAGMALCAIGTLIKRRWFDVLNFVVVVTGFAVLTYGLSMRWNIAGRIPASNMFESLLFLGWGAAAFASAAVLLFKQRLVPLTAIGMGATALFLADQLPMDSFIRPIAPVLLDTVWMSIHVPVIMVSYSVLALAVMVAHVQLVTMALAPTKRRFIESLDGVHYWYVQVGSLLLAAGIITGSMWAASSWGRYWGWDPKEVWSLAALLGYLTILHVRIDHERLSYWAYVIGGVMIVSVFVILAVKLAPLSPATGVGLVAALGAVLFLILGHGTFATAMKSILCFWLIIMTYVGVNYVLGAGLHSYGFGTGAVVRSMFLTGGIDLAIVAICALIYGLRRIGERGKPVPLPVAVVS